ncbi:RhoGAP-domain-containing protein [Epithele typhae]|uniref:RhoGAP-domain-containing protein n=1 Tax=Epithele typhae TaxID=378194 RepID=UPI002007C24E|nr:RhoGAP-domain-containing protein [Epithele typhae]KAH9942294.1 RhoGAP-domain-containing protein [Epithele typhae]
MPHRVLVALALLRSVPTSISSSSSLSSSLSSSRASSDLLPAASLSNSSQSDIIASDRSVSSLSSSSKPRFFPLTLSPSHLSPAPRTASPRSMGQAPARPVGPASPPPVSPCPSSSSNGAGNRIKRAWVGRRKKSEDLSAMLGGMYRSVSRERGAGGASTSNPPSTMSDVERGDLRLERQTSRGLAGPKLLKLPINVFGTRKASPAALEGPAIVAPWNTPHVSPTSPPPPTPPPKTASAAKFSAAALPPQTPPKAAQVPTVGPIPRQTPPLSHVQYMRRPSETGDAASQPPVEQPTTSPERQERPDKEKMKDDWRKSDATMTSHSTARPGSLSGSRSPRPVSLAESSHSGNTIVPPVNKRLSVLITDAEFTMFEEADGSVSEQDSISRPPASGRPSPTPSLKARNRRSASLSLVSARRPDTAASHPPFQTPARTTPEKPLASSRDTPTLTRTAAAGFIAPVGSAGTTQSASNNIRGKLAAWTAASAPSPQALAERPLPPPPAPQPRRQPGQPHPPPVNPTFRQTAVSMTGSLAPAAGFAMGFGKRAVEKVGRAFTGLASTASNHSGYSSSSSVGVSDGASGYASSHNSGAHGRKARRKVPQVSNTSSISSLASSSSEDHYSPSGPVLGRRIRSAKARGLVFQRDLRNCVRDTAIDDVQDRLGSESEETFGFKPLETRLLPALVVRCAQHIQRWGIQEEGLFRISGRSSHVNQLRSEFDAGADYNLAECDPGDLDPHAVSSILKTFLRELPEPVLTRALLPYFESALVDDAGRRSEDVTKQTPTRNGSNLPLRKPPSLSTLAMPTFAGQRAISESQLTAFSWLISRLPQENRDLLFTVVELIKQTAAHSKETKMPLGNLLLVFCPSLNMSPTLLRALCESDSIWNGPPAQIDVAAVLRGSAAAQGGTAKRSEPPPPDQVIDMRLPVIELDDAPDTPRDSPDDSASFVSALEPTSNVPTRTPSPLIYDTTVPPLSSSDSLDSSSVSEELVSPEPPSFRPEDAKFLGSAHSLAIPEVAALSLPSLAPQPRDITVPFPTQGGSVPHSPVTHAPLSHRKSYTLLSFPHLRSESSPTETTCDEMGVMKRPKRPSLNLLFTKKSTSSSAAGLYISAPISVDQPILGNAPPRLETTITSSPIRLGFDGGLNQLRDIHNMPAARSTGSLASRCRLEVPGMNSRSDSGGSSVFSTPQSTPIADFYRGRTASLYVPEVSTAPAAAGRARSASQVSVTPSIDIKVEETPQDDWTQSVLLAASVGESSRP